MACLAVGDDAEAARAAAAALAKQPQNGPARAVRGTLLLHEQKGPEALLDLETVPVGGLGGTLATLSRAGAYEKADDWARARQEYDRLLQRGVGSSGWLQLEAYLGRARAAKALDELVAAHEALADARTIDPQTAERLARKLFPAR
jgi:hypothetical protein